MNQTGTLLRKARIERGLTLHEVAKAAAISVPYLSDIERGNRRGSAQTIVAIAQAMHYGCRDLCDAYPADAAAAADEEFKTALGEVVQQELEGGNYEVFATIS